jgi:hypothetical protein
MSIISQNKKAENSFNVSRKLFRKIYLGFHLKNPILARRKGIPCVQVYTALFKLAFARDAAYGLLNSTHITGSGFALCFLPKS